MRLIISRRIVAQVIIDAALIIAGNAAAFLLRYAEDATFSLYVEKFALALPVLVALRLLSLSVFNLYRIHWRYFSIPDLRTLSFATTMSSLLFWVCLLALSRRDYSWGMQIIDWGINLFLLSGVRICYRVLPDPRAGSSDHRPAQRALIVGAGDAGEAVARDLLRRPREGIMPIGFVDDEPVKRRSRIQGLPVLGTTHDIAAVAGQQRVEVIIIALPSAPGKTIRDIVGRCEKTQARLCIVPSVPEILEGNSGATLKMRDINIEDLLRRPAVHIDMEEVAKYIAGQRVLVTGAGGSIGSELCRQICALNPARLLLLGQGENSIFEIEQELLRELGFASTALIGDIKDRERLEEIFLHERPTVVFHAAAHKHVPLMEANPQEAVKNNILGTRNLAELAKECGVKKFIYVSTDKAVNPTSVMGATKRIGEMIIQSVAASSPVEFAAVRFGNVLGSRGSVIPVMRKQIQRGGPVTVTDSEMTRYFMTIPEAVTLILQAGAMGKSGEIYILDMGEPVRILDLARDLIRLSGYRPDDDIKIEFTGIRPGEKIFEELTYDEEQTARTAHKKIFVSPSNGINPPAVLAEVDRLIGLATQGERDTLREEILRIARTGFDYVENLPARSRTGTGEPGR